MPNLARVGTTLDNLRWNVGGGGMVEVSGADLAYCTIGAGLCHLLAKIPDNGLDLSEVNSWRVENKLRGVSTEDVPTWLEELKEKELVEKTGRTYKRTKKADDAVYILKPSALHSGD